MISFLKQPLIIILQLLQQLTCIQWSQYWPNLHHFACSWPNNSLFFAGSFPFLSLSPFSIDFLFQPKLASTIVWASVSSTFFLWSYQSQLWLGFDKTYFRYGEWFEFWPIFLALSLYLKVPPNVGVQKSTVVSWVTGNVLETGTKHSPRLLRSCFDPSGSLDFSEVCIIRKIKYALMPIKETKN